MANKRKKHKILGGIKVSSKQLSEWGKSGGRPRKYKNSAERARAFRLKKKQEKFGVGVKLREYRSYEEKPTKINSFVRLICNRGLGHLDQQCSSCFQGKTVEKKMEIIKKRAGSSLERVRRWREKKSPMGSLKRVIKERLKQIQE